MGLLRLWKYVEKWAGEIEIRNTKLEIRNDTRDPSLQNPNPQGWATLRRKTKSKSPGEYWMFNPPPALTLNTEGCDTRLRQPGVVPYSVITTWT